MSLQINSIRPNIASFRPERGSANPPRSVLTLVPSQGYPPNATSIVAKHSGRSIIEDVTADAFEYVTFNILQDLFAIEEISIKNPAVFSSDFVIHDIDELMAGKEDEETPTRFAYANARQIVESAYGKAKAAGSVAATLPKPLATTDDVGGIRLLWNLGARNVRLNFGASEHRQSYLYYEADLVHGVEPLDEDHLAKRLAWLTGK